MLTDLSERKFSTHSDLKGHVKRERLAPLREEASRARLTLLQAPAGYGKTALLREWAEAFRRAGARVIYLALDSRDRDRQHLRASILRAAQLPGPGALAASCLPDAEFCSAFFASLAAPAERPLFLLLDNAHWASGKGGILRTLVEAAPPGVHLIAASRGRLGLPLAKLRAEDELVEIGSPHLKFHLDELTELAAAMGAMERTPGMLRRLREATDGWPIGAKIALRTTRDAQPALDRINGRYSDLADFFEEEVWSECDKPMRRFLAGASVLNRFCAELCAVVCDDAEAAGCISAAVERGLFVEVDDPERRWFRLQPLFRQFLRTKLETVGLDRRLCHGRATDWYDAQGMIEPAFDHAMGAGDPVRGAEILVHGYRNLFANWQYPDFLGMASRLPETVRAAYPEIGLAMAWPLAVRGQAQRVRQLIASSREELERVRQAKGTFAPEYRTLAASILHREMVQAQYCGRSREAEQMCLTLIDDYPDADPFTLGVTYTSLIHSACNNYHLRGLERVGAQAQECYSRAGVVGPNAFHLKTYARYLLMTGRSTEAVDLLSGSLEDERVHGYGATFASLVAIPLAATLYLRNELDRTRELIDRHGPDADGYGLVDLSADLWITRIALLRQAGQNEQVIDFLDRAWAAAEADGSERFRVFIGVERIRLLIALARPELAARTGRELGLPRDGDSLAPSTGVTQLGGLRAMGWARLAAAEGRTAEALRMAGQWATFARSAGLVVEGVRWQLLQATLHQVNGDQRAAQRSLRGALADAAPAHLVRVVLDEGPAVAGLILQEGGQLDPEALRDNGFRAAVRHGILAEMGHLFQNTHAFEPEMGVTGGLTRKELEILSMIGSGKRNADVARIVGMSEGSVKWYLQQIYDKVGVRKRSLAVERVRQLGLLT